MKNTLTKVARKVLPKKALGAVESQYRKARVKVVSTAYGNPSKKLRVLAITGTNGKTTTLSYLNEILKEAGYKTALFSTAVIEIAGKRQLNDLNATVGTTARMQKFFRGAKRARVDYVLLEITSHALIQHKLSGVPIEMAIMTNLTQDHLDYHKTMDEYAAAKALLFKKKPRHIVLNQDDAWFEFFNAFPASEHKITYGADKKSEVRIASTKLYRKGSEAKLVVDNQTKFAIATALPGKYNIHNAVAAVSAAYLLGVSVKDIIEGIANLDSVPGRFERAVEGKAYDVIVDYAHTPDALEKLLESAKLITRNRVILVFGACGDRDKSKRPIMGEIAAKLADRIFVTDEESYNEEPNGIRKHILKGIKKGKGDGKTMEIADRREAIKKALSIAKKGDIILITGMGHEVFRIVEGKKIPWNDSEVVRELVG
jgi:UDP-N-acetylmuramoyl-L-alanyl-D-glutamate--2,6-diaminopimelate ligase